MLEDYLVQTCYIVTPSRNKYGDFTVSTRVLENCRFREITTLRRVPQQEVNDTDAQLWLAPDTTATREKLVLFDGIYYQIERINKARRLGETEVQFVKCDLKVTDINVS